MASVDEVNREDDFEWIDLVEETSSDDNFVKIPLSEDIQNEIRGDSNGCSNCDLYDKVNREDTDTLVTKNKSENNSIVDGKIETWTHVDENHYKSTGSQEIVEDVGSISAIGFIHVSDSKGIKTTISRGVNTDKINSWISEVVSDEKRRYKRSDSTEAIIIKKYSPEVKLLVFYVNQIPKIYGLHSVSKSSKTSYFHIASLSKVLRQIMISDQLKSREITKLRRNDDDNDDDDDNNDHQCHDHQLQEMAIFDMIPSIQKGADENMVDLSSQPQFLVYSDPSYIPTELTISRLVEYIWLKAEAEFVCNMISLVYLNRFQSRTNILFTPKNWYAIWITCFIISQKTFMDKPKRTKNFESYFVNVSKKTLRKWEQVCLASLNLDLRIPPQIFKDYLNGFKSIYCETGRI